MLTTTQQISPFFLERKSALTSWNYKNGIQVACVLAPFIQKTVTSGTTDYSTSEYTSFRGTNINGYIIPELYMGQYIGQTAGSSSISVQRTGQMTASTTGTGAITVILRRRFVMDFPLRAGCTVGNFKFNGFGGTAAVNTLYEAGANTGATGTVTLQGNFGRMSTAGALTQIGTNTQTMTITSAAQTVAIGIGSTATGTTDDGDCIYFELIATVAQTARTSGANAIGVNWQNGSVVQTVNSQSNILLYFDLQ